MFLSLNINLFSAILAFLISCFLLTSCSGSSTQLEITIDSLEVKLSSPTDNSVFEFGDEIKIVASVLSPLGADISVEFYVNNHLKFVDKQAPFEYKLSNLAYRIGQLPVKAIVKDNQNNIASDNIVILINSNSTPIYNVIIDNTFPHDISAFTQGLVYDEGYLYESTGMYGYSSLRKVELETGDILRLLNISQEYFGEGVTILNDKVYQITWMAQKGFIYDKDTFFQVDSFSYTPDEGWGLTHDNINLIMSDGSSFLYMLNPVTFDIISQINITDNGTPINFINELEYIDGDIFANIWGSEKIARISLTTKSVIGWIDFSSICDQQTNGVLNGIAYDESQDRFFITGKNWDKLYEVSLVPKKN